MNAVRLVTWRDYVNQDRWSFPDVAAHSPPDREVTIDGPDAIAAFLGIPTPTLIARAQALRIPFRVPVQWTNPQGKPFTKVIWSDDRSRMLRGRGATMSTTAHALTLWMALNDPFARDQIAWTIPNSKGVHGVGQ